MELLGLSISNFRSIGGKPVEILPVKKINILIGQNNAGKSNTIKALQKIKSCKNGQIKITSLDFHNLESRTPFRFTIYVKSENPQADFGISNLYKDGFFFAYEVRENKVSAVKSFFHLLDWTDQNNARKLKTGFHFNTRPGNQQREAEMTSLTREYLEDLINLIPDVHVIPQFRQILPGDEYALEGKRIIASLGEFQHPPIGHEEKKDKFVKIQQLMRRLLHLSEANLEVPHSNDAILIENQGLRLPLESYGTGVHELIILATALYTYDNVIFCIEEPEIHLHPRLQRELLSFLEKETKNTYILWTAPHELDRYGSLLR